MVTRQAIERQLRELNRAENDAALDPGAKSAAVDQLSSTDVEGWANGASRGGRSDEREQEAMLWSTFPDYHREFERVVIDPPMAAIQWRMTGSSAELQMHVDLAGTTVIEFDDDARIRRFWLHYHDPFRSA